MKHISMYAGRVRRSIGQGNYLEDGLPVVLGGFDIYRPSRP